MSIGAGDSLVPPQTSAAVQVKLLDGGSFTATYDVMHAHALRTSFRMYAWAFHIYHAPSNRHIMWDVGLSAVRHNV